MSPRRVHWTTLAKVLADAVLINAAFFVAYLMRYEWQWYRPVDEAYRVPFSVYFPNSLALTAILLLVYWAEGAYS